MIVYTFDRTLDGLLTAVFDAFSRHQQPEMLMGEGSQLPLFCEEVYHVTTNNEKSERVWAGLEKRLPKEILKMITVSYLSELPELDNPLFQYVCDIFKTISNTAVAKKETRIKTSFNRRLNYSDPHIMAVTNIAHKVMHEQLRMKQFIRFQKAKDGTYLAVVSPDHNVLPLITDHFKDRFADQSWLIYDAKRKYGYYWIKPEMPNTKGELLRITFQNEDTLPFDFKTGQLDEDHLSENDRLFQDLWRTYFKAICIRERMNPKKQLNDMPRRYWKYLTEKQ